ncbi:MAG: T9SS C-terminal target domain-containing protein [Flavobacteriales bacterium]|nr:T9SS C-terminal target domain-containing protein [Flavobacteriales bacterium]MCB9363970.1 T9SS C-terminal target domain-containing protein [Flavobacteriales bacterium]
MQNGRKLSIIKLLVVFMAIISFGGVKAGLPEGYNGNSNKGGDLPTPTAGCAPAAAVAILEFNNVRARLETTGGTMFQDRANEIAAYSVPKQQTKDDPYQTAIFAAGLWIGGTDPNLNTKVAAAMFRGGNDFWPGPLDDNTESIDTETCNIFDQYFGVSRAMVNAFVAWHNDPSAFPNYQIPDQILNYPGKGNTVSKKNGADYYVGQHLAPFYDAAPADGLYNPYDGDYPKYDLIGDIDCRQTRDVRLFGDTTIWFVFNDKGNAHTQSLGGADGAIGMEIHGQAFAFATNDEINDMTFYNYELINKSSFTFTNTYFGQWVDADLGNSGDDFVGCDASRGLGYCYNGDNFDDDVTGVDGYGATPPAIGVDFFEGPYADKDSIDNPLTTNVQNALDSNGIPYAGLGIGYGDGIVDNERYGMRKFVYYNNSSAPINGEPNTTIDYYNYLQGKWKSQSGGVRMSWGGDGTGLASSGTGVECDLIFPGDSDPLLWSTQGASVSPTVWSEVTEGNTPADRRFLQSAGPFTLKPGAINDLTVGIVYARATSGNNEASITYLQIADDKAQALFDNCFKVLEGPNTPDITFQELENEIILFLSNNNPISNNFNEGAHLKDATISIPDTLNGVWQGTEETKDSLKYYDFQGYQVYQVKTANVSVTQLNDPSVARLIAQVDKEDDVSQIVNYEFDKIIGANVPTEMVAGENKGIRHSFRITEDAFSTGSDKKLVNHKTYHFIVMAYAYNNWMAVDPQDFSLGGQLKPYLASRTNSSGSGIRAYSAIPHDPSIEDNGTEVHSQYGDQPEITRIEGQGNGGYTLELTASSEAQIVANNIMDYPTYQAGFGPIEVKVIDPLNVAKGTYIFEMLDTTNQTNENSLNDAYWRLIFPSSSGNGFDTVMSDITIASRYEQLFMDQGISVTIKQVNSPGVNKTTNNGFISSSTSYSQLDNDWLGYIYDYDSQSDLNWIRSGIQSFNVVSPNNTVLSPYNDYVVNSIHVDPNEKYENIASGGWAPYPLISSVTKEPGNNFTLSQSKVRNAPAILIDFMAGGEPHYYSTITPASKVDMAKIQSVDIVFTNDQSKWTRSVVFESGNDTSKTEGQTFFMHKRSRLSVKKDFITPDNSVDAYGNPSTGMSWFPGYAVNIETGERLNIAFAEDSGLPNHNGRDMKMNPSSFVVDFTNYPIIDTVMAGRHYVYIFNDRYDECAWLDSIVSMPKPTSGIPEIPGIITQDLEFLRDEIASRAIWAGIPALNYGKTWLSSEARIKLRVEKPYDLFETSNTSNASNGNEGRPKYQFTMDGFAAEKNLIDIAKDKLATIKAVPNPYYAYSEYETDKLDTRVKITNLPKVCTVSIYNVNGTLMRRYEKAESKTSLDWDIKNSAGIPVAGGVYLIHIEAPNIGEKIIKWYGVTRPTDLGGF